MIELPKQLQDKRFRFIKIDSGTKKPYEEKWAIDNNYRYNESEFKQYLKEAKSYGVACGYGDLVIVDIENIEDKSVANLVMQHKFPSTFTTQTGSGGWHLYYLVPDIKKRIRLTKDGKHYGEIQSKGNQCIGPGSLHPSGNKYTILNNTKIRAIKKEDLLSILTGYTEEKDPSKFKYSISKGLDWDIEKLLKYCPDLKTLDGTKYRGSHPVHGSTTGQNFEIDLEKNTWYCFRCEIGGDAVSLIAMLEGIIKVDDFCPTQEQVKKEFLTIKKIGIEKYGYPDDGYKSTSKHQKHNDELTLFIKFGKKLKLNIEDIVAYIRKKFYIISIEDATGRASHIYVYDNGYYRLDGEALLRNEIKRIFSEANTPWSTFYENELLNYIKTQNPIKRDEIKLSADLINVNNGIYDLSTGKLKKHTPKEYFLYKIPWNYRPKAKLPKNIILYLMSTFNDNKEYIDFSQELFGYCMYSQYKFHGLFYLYGTGGNGKTVWLTLLQKLLGEDNIANKSINSLVSNRFTTALLYGKLLNSCGELSGFVLSNTDMLKRLTAGDRIEAEFKNKDGFDFSNTAKIITACNAIPESTDKTDGWYDRQYILPFLQKFRHTKRQDVELIEKLVTKQGMEGLLFWAIDGLRRILKNKGFTYTQNRRDKYLMYQGNTKYFVNKFYKRSDNFNDYVEVEEIRKHYEDWCKKNNIPEDTQQALARAFRYFKLPEVELISKNNNKIYVRHGIKRVD